MFELMNHGLGRILVTGGAGFIGSALVNRLALHNDDITVIDNLERGKLSNIRKASNAHFVHTDLLDYNFTRAFFSKIDTVFHLASRVGGIGLYRDFPYDIMGNNTNIDSNVIRASLRYGVKRFVYASSAHVYPNSNRVLTEDDAAPVSCELSYGWAKIMGEKMLEYATDENPDFHAVGARLIGIYGYNQDFDLSTGSVIPVFSHRAAKYPDIPFNIKGTGKEKRSYCFVSDAVDCLIMMAQNIQPGWDVVNVGSEDEYSIDDIANRIIEISGKDIKKAYNGKEASVMRQLCSCKKAEELYGWRASMPFDMGLQITYEDIKDKL